MNSGLDNPFFIFNPPLRVDDVGFTEMDARAQIAAEEVRRAKYAAEWELKARVRKFVLSFGRFNISLQWGIALRHWKWDAGYYDCCSRPLCIQPLPNHMKHHGLFVEAGPFYFYVSEFYDDRRDYRFGGIRLKLIRWIP